MPTLEELEKSGNPFTITSRPTFDTNLFTGVAQGGSLLGVGAELNAPTQARGEQVSRQLSLEDASTFDLLKASLNENSVVNVSQYLSKTAFKNSPLNIPEPDFDRGQYLTTLGIEEEDQDLYDGFNSKIGIDRQRTQLADRNFGKELFAANPIQGGTVFLGSQVLEPFNYVLIGRAAQVGAKGVSAAKAASTTGKLTKLQTARAALNSGTDASNATRLALEAFAAETGIEMVLQTNQEERTVGEAAINISSGTLFGAFVGAGARPIANLVGDVENKILSTALDIAESSGREQPPTSAREVVEAALDRDSSIGAQVRKHDGTKLGPRKDAGKGFKTVAKASKSLTPAMHGVLSKSPAIRSSFAELENVGVNRAISEADEAGSFGASPLGTKARQAIKEHVTLKTYKNNTAKVLRDFKAKGGGTLKDAEVFELAAMASRRGDRASELVHPKTGERLTDGEIKAVEAMAVTIRNDVFKPLGLEAVDVKLLEEYELEADFAESFFTRSYNKQLIKEQPKKWEEALSGAATRDFEDMPASLKKQIKAVEAKLRELESGEDGLRKYQLRKELDDLEAQEKYFADKYNLKEYIAEYAADARGSILSTTSPIAAGRFSVKKRGALKQRTLKALDTEIEDFLNNDVDNIIPHFIRTMTGEIEMMRTFGTTDFEVYRAEVLDPDIRATESKINREFQQRIKEAKTPEEKADLEAKLAKENSDLINENKDAVDTLEAMWNLARGTYRVGQFDPDGMFKRASYATRQMAMMAFLANFVVGSLVDVAMPSFVHGMGATIGRGPLSTMAKRLASPEFRKSLNISRQDLEDAGIAVNYVNNDRMVHLAMSEDTVVGQRTMLEKIISKMAGRFGLLTGGNFWNDNAQLASGIISARRMSRLRKIDLGSIKKKDREWLSRNGISSDDLPRITEMWEKHGRPDIEAPTFNFRDWEDQEIADNVKAALFNDNRAMILNRGDAEIPVLMNTDLGKIYGQFASHAALSHNRILMSSLERADKEVLIGLTNMVLFGAFAQYIKDLQSGREISDDWRVHLINGVNSSSILAVGMMANNNLFEKMGVGLSSLTGDEEFKRISQSGGLTLTPDPASGGYVRNLLSAMQGVGELALTGETSKGKIQAGLNSVPYLNIPPLKFFMDDVVDHLNKEIGDE